MYLNGKNGKMSFNEGKLAGNTQMDIRFISVLSALALVGLYKSLKGHA